MTKLCTSVFSITLFALLFVSCGANKEVTKNESKTTNDNYPKSGIVGEMLEQARQFYIQALSKQENGTPSEVVTSYESSLRIINNLSYYPGIDANEAYVELENSIIEDYRKYRSEEHTSELQSQSNLVCRLL